MRSTGREKSRAGRREVLRDAGEHRRQLRPHAEKLDECGHPKDTLVIYSARQRRHVGVKVFNAGMRGGKATPYQGGTRGPAFFRWPAKFAVDVTCPRSRRTWTFSARLRRGPGCQLDAEVSSRSKAARLMAAAHARRKRVADRTSSRTSAAAARKAAEANSTNCLDPRRAVTTPEHKELYDLAADQAKR